VRRAFDPADGAVRGGAQQPEVGGEVPAGLEGARPAGVVGRGLTHRGHRFGHAVGGRADHGVEVRGQGAREPLADPGRQRGLEQVAGRPERVDGGSGRHGPAEGGEDAEPADGDLGAEGGRGDVLELVRLVEDHEVVIGQHVSAAGEVGPVKVGVDDDDGRLLRPAPRLFGEAAITARAAHRARAVGRRGAQLGPDPGRRLEVQLGAVAAR
jgi:hypothetical protein